MKASDACGWIGMCLVQAATLPTTFAVAMGWNATLPPLSMILLVWSGLAGYLVQAIATRNVLYMASNGIGFALNTILLAFIVFPR